MLFVIQIIFSVWGGDEFLVIIPNATDVIAKKVIDTIHEKIETYSKTKQYNPGITAGYYVAEDISIDFNNSIKIADDMMYQNKHKN